MLTDLKFHQIHFSYIFEPAKLNTLPENAPTNQPYWFKQKLNKARQHLHNLPPRLSLS